MKIHVATINEKVLEVRSRESFYARQKWLFVMLVGLVALVPFTIHMWSTSKSYRESWLSKTSSDLRSLATSRAENIEIFLENQRTLLSSYVELNSAEELAEGNRLDLVFDALSKGGVITDLGVIDNAGAHLAYAGPYRKELIGRNYSDAEWFTKTLSSGRYISDVFLGYRGVPHQVVAVADNNRTWIIRATISSGVFNSLLKSADVGPGGDAFIMNRSGEVQTASRLGVTKVDAQSIATLEQIAKSGDVKLLGEFLTTALPLKGGDWLLVLKTDVHASLSEFYAAKRRDFIAMLVTVVTILAFSTIAVRSMVGRIEHADKLRASLSDRVRQAEKMALVGRIAASVAHEINNPLQIIGDQAGLLKEMLADEDGLSQARLVEYMESADSIKHNVHRASEVTHKLLGFSRGSGPRSTPTDIHGLLDETIGLIAKEALSNEIEIQRRFSPLKPMPLTDSGLLQQVFLNLLNNAMDAVGHGGSITISTSIDNGQLRVEFSDSGSGIPDHMLKRVFDPFYTTKGESGTGLGLSISFNIMQRLGGSLSAENVSGSGTVFIVSIPCQQEVPAYAEVSPQ